MNEILVRFLKTVFGAIGSDPKRLSVALSLGLVMKAVSQFLAKNNPENTAFTALSSIDVAYFIALAFFVLFIPLILFDRNNIDRDIAKLNELLNSSNLSEFDKRSLTRSIIKSYIHRISPYQENNSSVKLKRRPSALNQASNPKRPSDG